jgi:hypothetical protein
MSRPMRTPVRRFVPHPIAYRKWVTGNAALLLVVTGQLVTLDSGDLEPSTAPSRDLRT